MLQRGVVTKGEGDALLGRLGNPLGEPSSQQVQAVRRRPESRQQRRECWPVLAAWQATQPAGAY